MHGSNANCASDDELWIIGLTCATGSILLVTLLGVCVVSRVRRAARLDRERAEGRAPEQLRLRQRTERVVETDAFAKAALRAVVYNPRACVMRVWGADFARVARVCYLPEEYQKRGANEDREEFNLRILRFAHRMDL